MAWDEKGGVHTKKMIAAMAIFLIAATALCLMPSAYAADGDDDNVQGTYTDIRAESYLVGTGKTIVYDIYANDPSGSVTYKAKVVDSSGNNAGSVRGSPSTTVDSSGTTLTVTAPNSAGLYELVVDFTFKDVNDEDVVVTKTAPVRVVVPITLSAVIDNTDGGTIVNMDVWFVIDGDDEKIGEQTIDVNKGEKKTVTYAWVTEGLSGGTHTMRLMGQVGPLAEDVQGFDTPKSFYVGQNSYTLIETVIVILIIVLAVVLLFILRKPVKNIGKPKARR